MNSWKDEDGEALDISYMRMASPTAPLAEFYQAAGSRNACYVYVMVGDDGYVILSTGIYPTNTTGYYIQISDRYYHSPMFLMKYFAAVAANEVGELSFYTLNVAPYLEDAKVLILEQATGMDYWDIPSHQDEVNTLRLYHPHLPQTYCLLAMQLTSSAFN